MRSRGRILRSPILDETRHEQLGNLEHPVAVLDNFFWVTGFMIPLSHKSLRFACSMILIFVCRVIPLKPAIKNQKLLNYKPQIMHF